MDRARRVDKLMSDLNRLHLPHLYRKQLELSGMNVETCEGDPIEQLCGEMNEAGMLFPACVQIYNFSYSLSGNSQTRCFYCESFSDLVKQISNELEFHYEILRRSELSDYETMELGWKMAVELDRKQTLVNYSFGFRSNSYHSAEPTVTPFDVVWSALYEHSVGAFIVPAIQYESLKSLGFGAMNGREQLEFKECEQKLQGYVEELKDDYWIEMKKIWTGQDS